MPDYALELCDVSKSYDQFVAVDHLSLNIPKGSVYGLLGPNGAGKTSSLRMMIGITLPDSGEVRIFGQSLPARASASALDICRKNAASTSA